MITNSLESSTMPYRVHNVFLNVMLRFAMILISFMAITLSNNQLRDAIVTAMLAKNDQNNFITHGMIKYGSTECTLFCVESTPVG